MARTILVVDDEPDMELLIRQKFRKQISSGAFVFHFAGNGEQALEVLQKESEVELVMTDINMPVMSGLTLLEKVGDMGLHCKTLVVSAYNDIQNIRNAMNRGAFDFVTKPIDFQDLETTISKTLKAIDEVKDALKVLSERDIAVIDREKAMTSERFKQQFLANMSHEIRTPMNSVIGITHLLLRSHLEEQQKKYVLMIQAASEQLMSIINDILDISKIEAGKMVFEKIPFNIEQVASNVRNILSMKAEEKKLELRLNIHNDVPETVIGDPSRLAQILINLAGNSIKFTDSGFVEIDAVVKSKSGESCEIEFSVIDTGIGIAADKLHSIFESFTQANSDTSRKYGGTGLGLTISKQLVEMQGGKISLESKPGMGTRFFFNISYTVSQQHTEQLEAFDNSDSYLSLLIGAKVLLVEDNDFNKIVAEDTIMEYLKDVTMDHAENGLRAVEMISANNYDLVLMDIQMPEMDGYTATKTIRALDSNKKFIPIMAMTANATPDEISKCFESGMDDYISKPFIPDELFKKMALLVSKVDASKQV
jgi:signal transduction histidine kinase